MRRAGHRTSAGAVATPGGQRRGCRSACRRRAASAGLLQCARAGIVTEPGPCHIPSSEVPQASRGSLSASAWIAQAIAPMTCARAGAQARKAAAVARALAAYAFRAMPRRGSRRRASPPAANRTLAIPCSESRGRDRSRRRPCTNWRKRRLGRRNPHRTSLAPGFDQAPAPSPAPGCEGSRSRRSTSHYRRRRPWRSRRTCSSRRHAPVCPTNAAQLGTGVARDRLLRLRVHKFRSAPCMALVFLARQESQPPLQSFIAADAVSTVCAIAVEIVRAVAAEARQIRVNFSGGGREHSSARSDGDCRHQFGVNLLSWM